MTLSFAPKDMTTFSNLREGGYTYKTINFATLYSNCSEQYSYSSATDPPCANTITTEEASCDTQIAIIANSALSVQEHCYPQLSFPATTRLQGLNSAWAQCDMGNVDTSIIGVFDPPRALRPGTAMVAPAPTKAAGVPNVPVAAPASQALPAQPERTSSDDPSAGSGTPGEVISDPVSQNPPVNQAQENPAGVAALPTATTRSANPQEGAGTKPQPPTAVGSSPENKIPSDPNNESPAEMSAIHQALAPAPATSPDNHVDSPSKPSLSGGNPNPNRPASQPGVNVPPQNQPTTHGPAPNQPELNQPSTDQPATGQSANIEFAPNQPDSGQSSASQSSAEPSVDDNPGSISQESGSNIASPANAGASPMDEVLPESGNSKNPATGSPDANLDTTNSVHRPSESHDVEGSDPASPAQGQDPNLFSNTPVNNESFQPGVAAVNQGAQQESPVAASPPTFAIPAQSGQTLSGAIINPSSVIIAGPSGGATIQAGALPTQVSGNEISVDSAASKIIVNGQEHSLPTQNPAAFYDSNHGANNAAVVTPGSSSNGPVQGSPQDEPAAVQETGESRIVPAAPLPAVIANHEIAAMPSVPNAIVVDGQRLSQGETPTTISGTPIAFHANGDLVIGSSTIPNILSSIVPPSPPPLTTKIADHTVATIPEASNAILVDGQTISHGAQPVTISGTPVAYQSNGNLILGSSTIPNILRSVTSPPSLPSAPAILTVNGHAATILLNNAGVAFAGTTILPNAPAVAILGSISASLGSAGLIVGTSTIPLPAQFPSQISPYQSSMTSIILAGHVFTYPVAVLPTKAAVLSIPTASDSVITATSVVVFTSSGANGATVLGTSSVPYMSTVPVKASGTQSVASLNTGGMRASGPGNATLGPSIATSTTGQSVGTASTDSALHAAAAAAPPLVSLNLGVVLSTMVFVALLVLWV